MPGQHLSSRGTSGGIVQLDFEIQRGTPGNFASVPLSFRVLRASYASRDERAPGFGDGHGGPREVSRTVKRQSRRRVGKSLMIRRTGLNAQRGWHVSGRIVGAVVLLVAMTVFAGPSAAVTGDVKQS